MQEANHAVVEMIVWTTAGTVFGILRCRNEVEEVEGPTTMMVINMMTNFIAKPGEHT